MGTAAASSTCMFCSSLATMSLVGCTKLAVCWPCIAVRIDWSPDVPANALVRAVYRALR